LKIVTFTAMRNEADIIEIFCRYHLQFVDQMIIVNHRSIDSSPDIVIKLKEEGLPIDLKHEDQIHFDHAGLSTKLMKECVYNYDADWIVPIDADEFLGANGGRRVRDVISGFSSDEYVKVPWRTYIPTPEDNPTEENVLEKMQYRLKMDQKQFFKVVLPAKLAGRRKTALSNGNHALLKRPGGGTCKCFQESQELFLAHFPVRTENQIITKSFVGWLSALSNPARNPGENYHWKDLFDRLKMDERLLQEELRDLAIGYLTDGDSKEKIELERDPLIPQGEDIPIRYWSQNNLSPLVALAQMAEDLASELYKLKKSKKFFAG